MADIVPGGHIGLFMEAGALEEHWPQQRADIITNIAVN